MESGEGGAGPAAAGESSSEDAGTGGAASASASACASTGVSMEVSETGETVCDHDIRVRSNNNLEIALRTSNDSTTNAMAMSKTTNNAYIAGMNNAAANSCGYGLGNQRELPAGLSNFLESVSVCHRSGQHPEQMAIASQIENLVSEYDVSAKVLIGRGAFSHVYEGLHRTTKERVAIKAIRCNTENPSGYYMEYKMNKLVGNHPNIVKLLDSVAPHNGDSCLIFELCAGGEVFNQIIPNTGLAPRDRIGSFFAQLVEAVAHVHQCGVCHMDIKPENLFITSSGSIKLGDFGLSVLMEDGPVFGRRGSISYAAPENIRSKRQGDSCSNQRQGYDGQRSDMWSMGIILFVFLYGYTPWDVAHDDSYEFRSFKAFDGAPNRKPWNRMPTVFRTLFHRTLALRPSRRITAAALRESVNRDLGWNASRANASASRRH